MKGNKILTFIAALALGAIVQASTAPKFIWEITRQHKTGASLTPTTVLLNDTWQGTSNVLNYVSNTTDSSGSALRSHDASASIRALQMTDRSGSNYGVTLYADLDLVDASTRSGGSVLSSQRFEFWVTLYIRKDAYDAGSVKAKLYWGADGSASNTKDSDALGRTQGESQFDAGSYPMVQATALGASGAWTTDNMVEGWGSIFDLKTGHTYSTVVISGVQYYKVTNLMNSFINLSGGNKTPFGNTTSIRNSSLTGKLMVECK